MDFRPWAEPIHPMSVIIPLAIFLLGNAPVFYVLLRRIQGLGENLQKLDREMGQIITTPEASRVSRRLEELEAMLKIHLRKTDDALASIDGQLAGFSANLFVFAEKQGHIYGGPIGDLRRTLDELREEVGRLTAADREVSRLTAAFEGLGRRAGDETRKGEKNNA